MILAPGQPDAVGKTRFQILAVTAAWVMFAALAGFGASAFLGAPEDRFVDDNRNVHEGAINAVAQAGITIGCSPVGDRFCPDQPINRGELATMVARAMGLDPVSGGPFVDLADSLHSGAVNALALTGIAIPCERPDGDRFCPGQGVSRGLAAAFMARAFHLTDSSQAFLDTRDHAFELDISRIAAAGITLGCNPPANDRFCPDRLIRRGEIATMIARALGLAPIGIEHSSEVPSWVASFPGEPPPGTVIWGAALTGNSDPGTRHEFPTGRVLAVRRTFFQWHHLTSGYLESVVVSDVGAGRLPWISLKTPGWADMGAGRHDSEIDALLFILARAQGDVWLTIHHEPEGGGGVNSPDDPSGPAGHLAMNRRVRQRLEVLGVSNVALAPILMTYSWDPHSARNPDVWWDSSIYDFLGVDHYVCMSDDQACRGDTLLDPVWDDVRRWAATKGAEVAVGEWGMRGVDDGAAWRVQEWYLHAIQSAADGRGARVIGLAAFDSSSDARMPSWELRGAQLATFQQVLLDPRTARPNG